jgi:hypothetical protein
VTVQAGFAEALVIVPVRTSTPGAMCCVVHRATGFADRAGDAAVTPGVAACAVPTAPKAVRAVAAAAAASVAPRRLDRGQVVV